MPSRDGAQWLAAPTQEQTGDLDHPDDIQTSMSEGPEGGLVGPRGRAGHLKTRLSEEVLPALTEQPGLASR